ncbi:hypothetical protein GGX14DRAFT_553670 [Mycena pura]|uniref:Uncharacterized protein n=1 Tax=Mycena pura TaxID=153505 RepID=A0AAD6YV51_9AGAR|nr:hypothetical protein GGX14DRAFT_553670 [Mycena pura]
MPILEYGCTSEARPHPATANVWHSRARTLLQCRCRLWTPTCSHPPRRPARAAILVAAATRAPGSPPQHSHPRQRTPERGLERQGSARTPQLVVDVKRLLAKPVSRSASGRQHVDGRELVHGPQKSEDDAAQRNDDGARVHVREKSEREVALGSHRSGGENDKELEKKEKEKRPNVLRRRPSNPRPFTAPNEGTVPPATLKPTTARTAPPVLSLDLSLNPMSFDLGSPYATGAVAEAYKRGLDTSGPSESPLTSPLRASGRRVASDSGGVEAETAPSSSATPYYTVFGSTSGRQAYMGF